MYKLNYGTGAGDTFHATIEEAMAEVNPTYTQSPIYIQDEEGKELYKMSWIPLEYDPENPDNEENEVYANFGKFGYYKQWQDLNL